MEDYKILGISKTYDLIELKKAYRNKIKQIHPDRNLNDSNSHFKIIKLNKAYENLKKIIKDKSKLDYSIYKRGVEIYKIIHPSKWKKVNIRSVEDISVSSNPETIEIIDKLICEISEAYRCFSIIVNDYESSIWFNDSRIKMKELEKMSIRYLKIKKSYELDRKILKNHKY